MMHSYVTMLLPTSRLQEVLILVLMDDALVHWQATNYVEIREFVLILVLMDDALVPQNLGYALFKRIVRLVCAS